MFYFLNASGSWPYLTHIIRPEPLFGQTKVITDHDGLRVTFHHPSMKFTIKLNDSSPLDSFSNLSSQNSTLNSPK